ncbi:MAG: hypothetical protein IT436_08810 [Phycisphaerales bacterium]|nr:hypothetical protein [Phycisphaerales bacterium]
MPTVPPDRIDPLIASFLQTDLPLSHIAEHHDITVRQLLEWMRSPEIAEILDAIEALSLRRARVLAAEARVTALRRLDYLAASSDDPESARRAGAALLRAAGPLHDNPDRPPSAPQPRRRSVELGDECAALVRGGQPLNNSVELIPDGVTPPGVEPIADRDRPVLNGPPDVQRRVGSGEKAAETDRDHRPQRGKDEHNDAENPRGPNVADLARDPSNDRRADQQQTGHEPRIHAAPPESPGGSRSTGPPKLRTPGPG